MFKKALYKASKSRKNIFSSTQGLKGYEIDGKKYPATYDSYLKARKGKKVKYLY